MLCERHSLLGGIKSVLAPTPIQLDYFSLFIRSISPAGSGGYLLACSELRINLAS
jgi:hypothetical protein